MHKILIFLKRREGVSVAAFRDYYESRHVPLCRHYMQGAARYLRRYLDPLPDGQGNLVDPPYDVITETWFDDKATFDMVVKFAARGVLPQDVVEDEERLFDRTASRFMTVTEHESDLSQPAPPIAPVPAGF